jgi:hypothetical protein
LHPPWIERLFPLPKRLIHINETKESGVAQDCASSPCPLLLKEKGGNNKKGFPEGSVPLWTPRFFILAMIPISGVDKNSRILTVSIVRNFSR